MVDDSNYGPICTWLVCLRRSRITATLCLSCPTCCFTSSHIMRMKLGHHWHCHIAKAIPSCYHFTIMPCWHVNSPTSIDAKQVNTWFTAALVMYRFSLGTVPNLICQPQIYVWCMISASTETRNIRIHATPCTVWTRKVIAYKSAYMKQENSLRLW